MQKDILRQQNMQNVEYVNKSKKQVALVVLVLSLVVFVLSIFDIVPVIKNFVLGTFGLSAYVVLFFVGFFSLGVFAGKKFVYSPKYVVLLFLCYLFFVCVMHIMFTRIIFSAGAKAYGYIEYLNWCFASHFTPGGIVIGAVVFPVSSMLHDVAGLVIFSVALVLSIYFVVSYLQDLKAQKLEKLQKASKRYQNYENISSELGADQEKTLDEKSFFEKTNSEIESVLPGVSYEKRTFGENVLSQNSQIQKEENEDSIFIKDAESEKSDAAKNLIFVDFLNQNKQEINSFIQKQEKKSRNL